MLLGAIMYRNSVYVAVVVVLVVALLVGVVLVAMMEIVLRRNHRESPTDRHTHDIIIGPDKPANTVAPPGLYSQHVPRLIVVSLMRFIYANTLLCAVFSPPVGYQRVEGGGGEVGEEGESESDRELFVKGRTSGGQVKIGTEKNLPLKPVQEHTTTKVRLLQNQDSGHQPSLITCFCNSILFPGSNIFSLLSFSQRLLTVFIIQAFIFSAVIGSLILYGDH